MPLIRLMAYGWVIGVGLAALCDVGDQLALGVRIAATLAGAGGLLLWATGARRLGMLLLTVAVAAMVSPPHAQASPELFDGAPWSLQAVVDGAPHRDAAGEAMPIVLARAGVRLPDRLAEGRLRLRIPPPQEPIGPDDRLLLRARVVAPGRRCNFGACDGVWRAAAEGIDGLAFVAERAQVIRADRPPQGISARLWALREAMRRRIEARLPAADAGLVSALVVGERGAVDADEEARFRTAGVTHLLSVSGLHLAFAAGLLFAAVCGILRRLPQLGARRPRDRWAAAIALPIALGYAVLTGAEVATVRAAAVVGYAFVGVVCTRRVRARDALAFAVLALLIGRPASIVDPSFQLSFVAAWATLAVARGSSRSAGWLRGGLWRARQLIVVSLAATVATAPITALHFGQIAPAGIVTNLFAVPLTEAAIVPLGLAGALVDLVVPQLGGPLLLCDGALAALLRALVAVVARVSPLWIVAAPSALVLVVSAVGLLWTARAPSARRGLCAAIAVAACVTGEIAWHRLSPRLEITFLDVGQGDAAVLRLPDDRVVVIDGGGGGRSDPGAQVIAPYLLRQGVRRLALVVLSHPHPDHAGGLAELLRRFPVDELWTNGQPSEDPTVRGLLAEASAHGVRLGTPRAMTLGGVELEVLGPRDDTGALAADPLASENDNSLVLRVRYGGRSLLLTGDVEASAEHALVERGLTRADLLKVPHHGSRTSSTEALLDVSRPRWAIASLAAGNRYRFPHPDVVARYRARGIRLLRTDRDGAVRVRLFSDGTTSLRCARPSGCGGEP